MTIMELFSGVCTAMPTPFKKDLTIDFDAFKRMLDFQINSGVSALCILGTTGEAPALSFDEKIEIVKFALATVANRVPLIFGIGGNNLKNILELGHAICSLRSASREGAGGNAPKNNVAVLLSAPYYNKTTQDGAIKWFNDIANEIKLPLIVYNVPTRTGMNLTPETISQICKNKYVAGIKQATPNFAEYIDTIRLCPNTPMYAGDDGFALPAYAIGARGIISVASNVRPRETIALWGVPPAQSSSLFLSEIPYYNALFCEINPSPVKYALSLMGLCENYTRPPLTQLSEKSIIQHGFHKLFGETHN